MDEETRQQRRARERAELKRRVHGGIDKATPVFDVWTIYRDEVLKNITHPVQIEETRRAFYAGVAAMLDLLVKITPDDISEDRGVEMLEALQQELRSFATDMRKV